MENPVERGKGTVGHILTLVKQLTLTWPDGYNKTSSSKNNDASSLAEEEEEVVMRCWEVLMVPMRLWDLSIDF